jgi:hypothetical protein
MTKTKTPTPAQIVEQEADEARAVHTQIVAALRDGRAAGWRLAEALYEFDELRGWSALGYESLNEYLADPEITIRRSTYFELVGTYKAFAVERKIEFERLETIDMSKAAIAARALNAVKASSVEDALADAETLGARDLREKYGAKSDYSERMTRKRSKRDRSERSDHLTGPSHNGTSPNGSDQSERSDPLDEPDEPDEPAAGEVVDAEPDTDATLWAEVEALPLEDLEGSLLAGGAYTRVPRAWVELLMRLRQAACGGR